MELVHIKCVCDSVLLFLCNHIQTWFCYLYYCFLVKFFRSKNQVEKVTNKNWSTLINLHLKLCIPLKIGLKNQNLYKAPYMCLWYTVKGVHDVLHTNTCNSNFSILFRCTPLKFGLQSQNLPKIPTCVFDIPRKALMIMYCTKPLAIICVFNSLYLLIRIEKEKGRETRYMLPPVVCCINSVIFEALSLIWYGLWDFFSHAMFCIDFFKVCIFMSVVLFFHSCMRLILYAFIANVTIFQGIVDFILP